MMKELKIIVKIVNDEIHTATSKVGFTKDSSGILEVIGILENLKQLEIDKLKVSHHETLKDDDKTVNFG